MMKNQMPESDAVSRLLLGHALGHPLREHKMALSEWDSRARLNTLPRSTGWRASGIPAQKGT